MINKMISSAGVGSTIQTAELDDDSVTSAKIANLDADLTLDGGVNIILATSTGTQIGEASNQLLGFYGTTAVDQPAAVADATGTGDIVARFNELVSRMEELGLIAS